MRADVAFTVGGSLRVETKRPDGATWSFSGRYTRIEPNVRIAHTLAWDAPMGYDAAPEPVEVHFHPDGDGSLLDFVHAGIPDAQSARGHLRGWTNALETLAEHLEH